MLLLLLLLLVYKTIKKGRGVLSSWYWMLVVALFTNIIFRWVVLKFMTIAFGASQIGWNICSYFWIMDANLWWTDTCFITVISCQRSCRLIYCYRLWDVRWNNRDRLRWWCYRKNGYGFRLSLPILLVLLIGFSVIYRKNASFWMGFPNPPAFIDFINHLDYVACLESNLVIISSIEIETCLSIRIVILIVTFFRCWLFVIKKAAVIAMLCVEGWSLTK